MKNISGSGMPSKGGCSSRDGPRKHGGFIYSTGRNLPEGDQGRVGRASRDLETTVGQKYSRVLGGLSVSRPQGCLRALSVGDSHPHRGWSREGWAEWGPPQSSSWRPRPQIRAAPPTGPRPHNCRVWTKQAAAGTGWGKQ